MITIAIVCRTTVIESCGTLQQDKKCITELLYKSVICTNLSWCIFLFYVIFLEFVC